MLGLIDQLKAARHELAETRSAAVWAAVFPSVAANGEVNAALLAGGLRQPVERTLGLKSQVQHERVLMSLREDADWLVSAATVEQKTAMAGDARASTAGGALWADSEEGREAEKTERQEAIRRYTEMWGRPPA